jgi:protein-S-isoprenylcysteine O-methyltransferase Ste14
MLIKRVLLGAIASLLIGIPPTLGNPEILRAPHIWILLALGVMASALQPGYNPFTITTKAGDKGTGAQIIWSVYATQLAAILEAAYLRYPGSVEWNIVAVSALVTAILGLTLRTWAVCTLGSLFTMHLAVEKEHRVIRNGPYAAIRHPSYVGAFVLYVASTVFMHAWFSAVATAVVLAFAFQRRIYYEEQLLRETFGKKYEAYCAEVKRVIPGIW